MCIKAHCFTVKRVLAFRERFREETILTNADWITLCIFGVFALIGGLAGFGRGLKFFTGGIFGVVISVFLCYCFGGFILQLQFVQDLVAKFAGLWNGKEGFFYDFLTNIHFEIIFYYIVLFIVAQIVRKIIVIILKHAFEINFMPMKVINRVLGIALFVGMMILLALVAFQIIDWVGGTTRVQVLEAFDGSVFKLDYIFENNPLNSIIEQVQRVVETILPEG